MFLLFQILGRRGGILLLWGILIIVVRFGHQLFNPSICVKRIEFVSREREYPKQENGVIIGY